MPPKKKQDFESRLARLTEIVETLEREDAPLEKGMDLYKEGVELVKACREQLEKARYEVTVYSQESLASQTAAPLGDAATGEGDNTPQEEQSG